MKKIGQLFRLYSELTKTSTQKYGGFHFAKLVGTADIQNGTTV